MEKITLRDILVLHFTKYPGLDIQDLYKLIFQASLGPRHSIERKEDQDKFLSNFEILEEPYPEELLCEPIDPEFQVIRINLRPFKAKKGNPKLLFELFIRGIHIIEGSIDKLRRLWYDSYDIIDEIELPFSKEVMDDLFNDMERRGFPSIGHSPKYKKLYRPHYRVIATRFLYLLL